MKHAAELPVDCQKLESTIDKISGVRKLKALKTLQFENIKNLIECDARKRITEADFSSRFRTTVVSERSKMYVIIDLCASFDYSVT